MPDQTQQRLLSVIEAGAADGIEQPLRAGAKGIAHDFQRLIVEMMMADYKPSDCSCGYPQTKLQTGSGHAEHCPSHERWISNGRTWRPAQEENLNRHTVEAREILDSIEDYTDRMQDGECSFVEGLLEQFEQYGDRTFITDRQMAWLRDLSKRYA